MKLAQVRAASTGVLTAAIVHKSGYRLIIGHTMASLIQRAEAEDADLGELAEALALVDPVTLELAIPVSPTEVWACGCTYAPSAEFRDGEVGGGEGEGPYAYVSNPEHRPELFFKGTGRVCVGPNEKIGIRPDYVTISDEGLPVSVKRVEDVGRHRIIRAEFQGQPLNAILPEGMSVPADPRVAFAPAKINVYANDWRVSPMGG